MVSLTTAITFSLVYCLVQGGRMQTVEAEWKSRSIWDSKLMILLFLTQTTSNTPCARVAVRSSMGSNMRCSSTMSLSNRELKNPQYFLDLPEQAVRKKESTSCSVAMRVGFMNEKYSKPIRKAGVFLVGIEFNEDILWMSREDQTQFLEAKRALEVEIAASVDRFHQKVVLSPPPRAPEADSKHRPRGPEKTFRFEESLLTKMFQIQDFLTIYNMAIASFIILTISIFYDNYISSGEIIDMATLQSIFGEWNKIPKVWFILTLIHFSIIPLTKLALLAPKKVYIPLYLLHIYVLMSVAMKQASKEENMGFASRLIIMAEGTRMLMKSHSYFRNKLLYLTQNNFKHYVVNSIKVVSSKPQDSTDSDIKQIHIPIQNASYSSQFRKLGYFFFAPTLIYRDSYLLSTHRSPSRIIKHFINFLGCVYYALILYKMNCKPIISQLESKLDWTSLLSTIVNLMLPSVGFLILGFFGFLHSWLNLWAEITRFPDRAFYSDWWNSFQFGSYYRKWNIVVHDWLYYYLYLDICRCFPLIQRNRWVAQLTTFVVSAVIHELIVDVSLGYFYPILFLLFAGPGVLFVQSTTIKKNSVNLIFWLEMYIGTAMMMTFYLVECFARERVTDEFIFREWGNLSFLIPRTIYL